MKNNGKQKRLFSGVQPSASQVHLGNYLGAMKRFVELADQYETIVCVVDLHALTSIADKEQLKTNTLSLAAAYLAIGLDPEKVTIFRQSDVPEVCEMAWYLSCRFPLGLLERAHSLKDARAKEKNINSGVAFYPVLMAADILLYKAQVIPVGADQKQHIEMTRDVAVKFNQAFGDIFPLPEPFIDESVGLIPGIDGRKMSKSYDNYIGLFEDSKSLKNRVMQIVSDSKTLEEKKDPDSCHIVGLYKHFASAEEVAEMEERYRAGGYGYGHAKLALLEVLERELSPIRDRYNSLMKQPEQLLEVLERGAEKARKIALATMNEVREAQGI